MPYVTRKDDRIVGLSDAPQYEGQEFLENAKLAAPPKTAAKAIAEGFAALALHGWTQDALMSAPYAAQTAALQVALEENAVAILTMRKAARDFPETFDPANFIIPHSPSVCGL